MTPTARLLDLGTIDYSEAHERQLQLFDELVAEKENGTGDPAAAGWILMCEHPHVYTLGKSGRIENMLVSERFLRERGAQFYKVERGGDITYHGPGQLVCYPILDLEKTGIGLREYIEALERSVIETLAEFGIEAARSEGKTGVWVKGDEGREVLTEWKICAIGVRASRGVVMHGLALNVATDLGWFEFINPCGYRDSRVTSMETILLRKVPMSRVKKILAAKLAANLGVEI